MKKILVLSLAALLALPMMAWGPEGHRVIAKIAYAYMNKKTTKQVDKVLGKSGLVFWANWPDEIKSDTIYPHSFDWHFQDMDPGLTDEQVAAMLTDYPAEGGNMFRALDSLAALLKQDKNNFDALRFFAHISGDRYCPMHMGHMEDKGGNTIKLKWFYTPTNLHRIWDENLIEYRGYSYSEYAALLIDRFGDERKTIEATPLAELTVNNYHITSAIYAYQELGDTNTYHYAYRWKDTLDHQLFIAGVRLAQSLNEIFK
ncbi:MAG: S1/P1 nuclease [Paludibacteraceae bacterium]|nr:S1/P1 nuclease [Paludibacteraceae bacterium]